LIRKHACKRFRVTNFGYSTWLLCYIMRVCSVR